MNVAPAHASPAPPAPAAGGPGGALFTGTLESLAPPDLVEFLRTTRRSGVLACTSGEGDIALRFREGRLCGASGSGIPSAGELLVEAGLLAPAVLELALRGRSSGAFDEGAAARLLLLGLADAAALEHAMIRRVRLAAERLLRWREGAFTFSRDEGGEPSPVSVSLDPQAILLDLLREQDEASRGAPPPSPGAGRDGGLERVG